MLKRNIAIIFSVFTVTVHAYENYSLDIIPSYKIYRHVNYAESEGDAMIAQLKLEQLRSQYPGNGHWHRVAKNLETQLDDFWNAKIFNVEHVFPKVAATAIVISLIGFGTYKVIDFCRSFKNKKIGKPCLNDSIKL